MAVTPSASFAFSQMLVNRLPKSFRHVGGNLYLACEREHVRVQARGEQYLRFDLALAGVRRGLAENIGKVAQCAGKNRNGRLIHRNGHGDLHRVDGWFVRLIRLATGRSRRAELAPLIAMPGTTAGQARLYKRSGLCARKRVRTRGPQQPAAEIEAPPAFTRAGALALPCDHGA